MRRHASIVVALIVGLGVLSAPAGAEHESRPSTKNMKAMGDIEEPKTFGGFGGGDPDVHTDIAFWDDLAIQGNWDGFNIRDISSPGNPKQISRTFCDGDQGDVVVWDNIVVRSWNTPAPSGKLCDGVPVPSGFEGLHVFDISDLSDPVLVAQVFVPCGSHTATGVPDPENDRLLIYNSGSNSSCTGIHIAEVPLSAPATSSLLSFAPMGRQCHDTGVILGDEMIGACAGGDGYTLFAIPSLDAPVMTLSVPVPTVTIGHSAAFTWDGEVLIFGHEPGGGVAAECEATDDPAKKSFFFYDTDDAADDGSPAGALLGTWLLPRPQSSTENCTLHNLNVVPLRGARYVLVHGSYQSGTSVVDFTDPSAAFEVGYSDPPPRPVPSGSPLCCDLGGAWSSYWYDGLIYETHINEGLNIFNLTGKTTAGARKTGHLNPQTQEFTIG